MPLVCVDLGDFFPFQLLYKHLLINWLLRALLLGSEGNLNQFELAWENTCKHMCGGIRPQEPLVATVAFPVFRLLP